MITWILIAYLGTGYGGGPVAIEFHTEEGCQAALATLKKEMYGFDRGVCVPNPPSRSRG